MHINAMVLSTPLLLLGWLLSIGGMAVGLKKLTAERCVFMFILSALYFLVSIPAFELGPLRMHLCLGGLMGLLLGWSVFPAIMFASIIQAAILDGVNVDVIGFNAALTAIPAMFMYYLFGSALRRFKGRAIEVFSFIAGVCAALLPAAFLRSLLVGSYPSEATDAMAAMILASIVEGTFTALAMRVVKNAVPDLLAVKKTAQSALKAPAPTPPQDDNSEDGSE